ncbi:MAG: Hsp70 family protein, partial [Candidatus Methanomethylophilaceae archaeon]|nr:Hsp70 family protein [Candidatus Methanomethylophilaceae archaeon]
AMTYEILAKEGDLNLGGNDWDELLADTIRKKLGIESFSDAEEEGIFRRAVTKLKIELTSSEDSMIFFQYNGADKYTRFTRQEFEDATEKLLERSMETVRKALDSYSGTIDDMDRIVMVGGSSNMPQIKRGLSEEFPDFDGDRIMVYDPSKAIAKGAALFSKFNCESGRSGEGAKIIDICSTTYGFDSHYHMTERAVYNMIYRGTPFGTDGRISIQSDSSFIPLRDSQTAVSFVVYESAVNKGDGFEGNWFHLGNGETENGMEVTIPIPRSYYGRATQFHMWVEYVLDSNGILEMIITDPDGNRLGYTSSAVKDFIARR